MQSDAPRLRLRHEPALTAKFGAFPYQSEAVDFVCTKEYSAVFHEQGLGKTKIALDVALRWLVENAVDAVLIITKKSLVANWQSEIVTHTHIAPLVLSSSSKRNYYSFTTGARIFLMHFEVARKERARLELWLSALRVGAILDESAKIKNPESTVAKALHGLAPKFRRRLIMTGTPAANRPYDVWSQIYFLDQGKSLGVDYEAFRRRADLGKSLAHDQAQFSKFAETLDGLWRSVSDFSVRETKDRAGIELPKKSYHSVSTDWEPRQLDLYQQVREELRALVVRDGVLISDNQDSILKRMLRLIQIASNPRLIDQSYDEEPGKFSTLYDLVSKIVRDGEKAIVWSQFNDNVDWLTAKLNMQGALAVHGRMSMEDRNRNIRWFKEKADHKVLVATQGSSKEGLTLTVANHVIFFDRGYSLDDYLQSQDRIHRVSQQRHCHVYNLIMSDSIDEWINELIHQKHLAAQLAQGDVTIEEYKQAASMDFFELIRQVLGHDD